MNSLFTIVRLSAFRFCWRQVLMPLVFVAVSGFTVWAQTPTNPTSLIPANSPASFSLNAGSYGVGSIQGMTVTTFDGTNISTMSASGWEIAITSQPAGSSSVQLSANNQVAVAKGDLIVATFYYRRKDSSSGGEANFSCAFQSNTAPFLQSFQLPLRGRAYPANALPVNGNPVTPSDTIWRRVSIPFTSGEAYAVGAAQFNFSMGTQVQTLDIVPVSLTDYGQTSVFGSNTIDSSASFTNVTSNLATITRNIPITGLPLYTTGTQIQVTSPPPQTWPGPPIIWNVRLDSRLPIATNVGDTFVAIFWMRATALPAGVPYAQGGIAFTGGQGSTSMMADSNWRQWIVPMKVTAAQTAFNTDFYFMFGGQLQTVQVAGLQLMNLGQALGGTGVKCTLTSQLFDYPGRSLNDPWRAAAAANIAKYRQGPLTVDVVDANGNGMPGINVAAAMKSHQFGFGCQVSPNQVLGPYNVPPGPDPMFTKIFPALFQHAEMGSYKWGGWESGTNIAGDAQALASLRASGVLDVRAHNLIWPADSLCPADVVNITSAAAMTARINGHIMGPSTNSYPPEVSHATVKSYFSGWDAVNEPYDHNDEMQVVNGLARHTGGETQAPGTASATQAQSDATAIAGWLAVTRAADPYPNLYINDWGIETNINHIDTSHEDYDANLLTDLENSGAQVDGMGFESHFYDAFTGPLLLKKMFDRFATGLAPGHSLVEAVTEFEATQGTNATFNANFPPDIDLYTDYMNDFTTEIFSEPNFNFFDLWLTSDLYSATYNNWTLLPQGEAWISLVRNQWWTNTSASTDTSGAVTMTGYLGRYALTASNGAITKTYFADLPSNTGATVNLQLSGSNGNSSVWLYEAERKNNPIYAPLVIQADPYASGGQYVVAPVGGTNNSSAPTSPEMRIDTEATGTVNVWMKVIAPANEDTFWMAVDTGAWQAFPLADGASWHWVKYTTTLSLASGTTHSLFFAHGACGAELDQVLITNDLTYVPTSGTAPAAPTALAATAGNNQVSLSWTAPNAATSYTLLRSTTTGTGYAPLASGLTTTSYVDTTAVNGTAYYYVVEGVNPAGPGAASAEATATPIAPPVPPTGLVVTAGDTQVGLTWTASAGAASYTVLRSTTSGGGYVSIVSNLATTSYSDTGLTDGTTYYYVISATNASGTSAISSEFSVLPVPPIPAAPASLLATAGDGQVGLTWTASAGAASYTVLRSTTSGSGYVSVATGLTSNGFTDSGLTDGTSYYYVVTATNLGGTSAISTEASALPLPLIPAVPASLTATAGSGQVSLTWAPSNGATSYVVLRSTTSGSGYVGIASGLTLPSYVDSGLANGTVYYYVVEAVNLGGASTLSNQASATPLPAVPAAPTGLVATAGNAQIGLTWTASTGAASYTVLRSTTNGSGYISLVSALTTPSYTDTGLTNGTTYYYVVQAVNAGGTSGNSTPASTTPFPAIPTAPTGLVATAGNAQVGLTWTASTGAASYTVLRTTTSGSGYVSVASALTTTSYTDTGLTNGTTYYYAVRAVNPRGTSVNSSQASAKPLPPIPAAPTGFVATAGNAQVELSWAASSGAASYTLLRSTTSGSGYASVATALPVASYTDGPRINGTTYYYVVRAVNVGGTSANSAEATAKPVAPIAAPPTNLVATAGTTQIVLTWTAATGATSYTVLRSTTSGSGYTSIKTGNTSTTYTNTGLTTGTTYSYVVQAVNTGGSSANSNEASATIAAPLAAPPTGLVATAGNAQVKLSWTASTGAKTYNVLRSTTSGSGYAGVTTGLTTNSYTNTSLSNGTTYYYVVQAVTAGGTSANSAQASATPLPPTAAAPTKLVALAGNAQVVLTWTASSGATTYSVLRTTTSGSGYAIVAPAVTVASYTDSSLTNGTTYYYVVEAVNLGGASANSNQAGATPSAAPIVDSWLDTDIGSVGLAGGSTYSAGTFTLNGSGLGIAGNADAFDYTYQTLLGDGTIIARVANQSGGESGVAVRGTLDGNALEVSLLVQSGVGAQFQYRTTIGSTVATGAAATTITAPYWVKLARAGDVFTGSISPDGMTWTQTGQITNPMTGPVYIGLAQSSMSNTALASCTFDNVAIVPAPTWASQDIGTVPFAGASYYSNNVATVHGAGANISDSADQFRFTYTTASGDCDITARVATETNPDPSSKAGLMIRSDLTAGSAHAGIYLMPGSGVSSQWRTTAGGTTASTTVGGFYAPYWLRITRVGSTFTTYRSKDGVTWTKITSETITMPANVYLGLPVCAHNTTGICTATFDNIIVDP